MQARSCCTGIDFKNLLWAGSSPEVPKRYRREVAHVLTVDDLYLNVNRFDKLLDSLWVLDNDPYDLFSSVDRSLRAEIDRHLFRNPGDWSVEELFDRLGEFEASDRRFAFFIEGLASSEVRPDEAAQRRFVPDGERTLRGSGVQLRETDTEGG